ncbi:MAG: helix-turn-helix transcriptional regulator [Hyphomonadaceae bacterium]|nr:helix-turn-helix transcriptional regulator [Hyphomonadaceae bacterium]
MESIGERIKKARLQNGLSQVELAEAASVSQPTVANWETGSHAPRRPALLKLAEILNSTPQWFLAGGTQANGHNLAHKQYLGTPIHHIPIVEWPKSGESEKTSTIDLSDAHDYIALSLKIKKPFALIANDPAMSAQFPIGSAIVFDAVPGPLEDGACYLFDRNGEIELRCWQSSPDRLEVMSPTSAIAAEFTGERPIPVARAIMSLKRH